MHIYDDEARTTGRARASSCGGGACVIMRRQLTVDNQPLVDSKTGCTFDSSRSQTGYTILWLRHKSEPLKKNMKWSLATV